MRLSDYAKKNGIGYRTAWNHYKLGLIPNARKLPSGIIIVSSLCTSFFFKTEELIKQLSKEDDHS